MQCLHWFRPWDLHVDGTLLALLPQCGTCGDSCGARNGLQVFGILLCVVAFGYVVGFVAGLLTACIFFVVNYSRIPFIALDTTLATARSTVIRNPAQQARLTNVGDQCRVGRFEGFVFFGVASAIYDWYRNGAQRLCVLDFSRARGIDPSAAPCCRK